MKYFLINFPEGDSREEIVYLLLGHNEKFIETIQRHVAAIRQAGAGSNVIHLGNKYRPEGLELTGTYSASEESDEFTDPFFDEDGEEKTDSVVVPISTYLATDGSFPLDNSITLQQIELSENGFNVVAYAGKNGELIYETGFITYDKIGIVAAPLTEQDFLDIAAYLTKPLQSTTQVLLGQLIKQADNATRRKLAVGFEEEFRGYLAASKGK